MNENRGSKNIETKNIPETVSAVSPVFPPAAMPVPLSTKVATVDTPKSAPVQVAHASDSIIFL